MSKTNKMKGKKAPLQINSISTLHEMCGFPKPKHPMISIGGNGQWKLEEMPLQHSFLLNFYKISFHHSPTENIGYGPNYYDFKEGGMIFTAPNQLLSIEDELKIHDAVLYFHPDFIRNYPLGKTIKEYGFFSYNVHEALFLSEKEKTIILSVFNNIEDELNQNIDHFSQDVMVSYLEVLLNYCNRFYHRQFITRKPQNNHLLADFNNLLDTYFENDAVNSKGLPTVQLLADELAMSPDYLSDMLRSLTGQNTQQHIHNKMIEKAKEMLSSSRLSVSEIAYQLGYEYPQSFSKLFKRETNQTPTEFKQSLRKN